MYREKPSKDKRNNDLEVLTCFNKRDIQRAWQNYYGFIHYYPSSVELQELKNENLDIDTFCFSLGYTYVTGGRDLYGRFYWRYSSWGNWEYS